LILSLFSTKNEEFPSWNSRNKERAMVPSVNFMHAIRVIPFLFFKIKLHDVVELHFRIPSTIDENFSFTGECRVTSSTFWWTVSRDNFFPSLALQIKSIKIVESDTRKAETSMTSKDVNFAFVDDS
jgi:hypothetical protein